MAYFLKKADRRLISIILLVAVSALVVALALVSRSGIFAPWRVKEAPATFRVSLVKLFPFSTENSLKEWEEKIFKDKVVYRIESDKDLSYVRATSKAAASALYYRVKMDAKRRHPVVSWKWRVEKFPSKKTPEDLQTQNEDDFAARVYVIFPALFFTNSKVLEYIWTERLPVGMVGTSPYSKNIKLIVKRSGPAKAGEWAFEEVDIAADYKRAFGRPPEYDIGAVAFMTNAEHTLTSADAMYDEIKLGYMEEKGEAGSAN